MPLPRFPAKFFLIFRQLKLSLTSCMSAIRSLDPGSLGGTAMFIETLSKDGLGEGQPRLCHTLETTTGSLEYINNTQVREPTWGNLDAATAQVSEPPEGSFNPLDRTRTLPYFLHVCENASIMSS